MGSRSSSAHPIGSHCIDGDHDAHEWQPVSFRFETQLLDPYGRVLIRQPSLDEAKVYFICMKCRGWTYAVFDWVGYYLGDPEDVRTEQLEYRYTDLETNVRYVNDADRERG